MKGYVLSALMLFQVVQPCLAATAEQPVDVSVMMKQSKTVGEFLNTIKPVVGDKWSDLLNKKAEGALNQKIKVDVKGKRDFVIHAGKQMVSLQVVDVNEGKYAVNHKAYVLDAAKSPEQVWEDVMALMPSTGKHAAIDWILPRANADMGITLLVAAMGALAVGGVAAFDATYTDKNCRVYGTYMNGACFSPEHGQMIEAVIALTEVDGKRVGICNAKERTENCLRDALASGKLKTTELTSPKSRAYLERLKAAPKATADASEAGAHK